MFRKMLSPSNEVPGGVYEDLTEFRDTCRNSFHGIESKFLVSNNGMSRGFGFVNFESLENAKGVLKALNGSLLGQKVLYIARAQKRVECG